MVSDALFCYITRPVDWFPRETKSDPPTVHICVSYRTLVPCLHSQRQAYRTVWTKQSIIRSDKLRFPVHQI